MVLMLFNSFLAWSAQICMIIMGTTVGINIVHKLMGSNDPIRESERIAIVRIW